MEPTYWPIMEPTYWPIMEPTYWPIMEPTYWPIMEPTYWPIMEPTYWPIMEPTYWPIMEPTYWPIMEPTYWPIMEPTYWPIMEPTYWPIMEPTYWSYFRPSKFKTYYLAPQFFIFRRTVQIAPNFLHWNAHIFLFWLNPTGHSKLHNTSNTLRLLPIPVGLLVLPCTRQCRRPPPPPLLPAKAGACARDRRALQQLALNVHVKHFDL